MTNEERCRRNLFLDPSCPSYGCVRESILHVLRDCPPLGIYGCPLSLGAAINSTPWRCFFPSLLWQLWKRRNEFVFNASWLPLVEAYRISITWAAYFADIRASARTLPTSTFVYHQWKKPAMGWLCLNTDASISSADGVGTIGGVLRDSSGTWLRGYCKCIACSCHSRLAAQTLVLGFPMDSREMNMVADCLSKMVPPPRLHLNVFDDEPETFRPFIIRDVEGPPYSRPCHDTHAAG
ncbi:hypothetical protein V6N12_009729 [Hibiscus sabdariffa]|uniref:RNase H type-1 domain-containing protein n=1 Tax=Hibiscus sabdariffa TaxID=183260 RepID=A0ABR2ALP5_9ROSI